MQNFEEDIGYCEYSNSEMQFMFKYGLSPEEYEDYLSDMDDFVFCDEELDIA